MNPETANYIMQRMSKYLDNSQMIKLKDTLDESLRRSEDGILEKSSQELLDMFLATKRLEGRSEKTASQKGLGAHFPDNRVHEIKRHPLFKTTFVSRVTPMAANLSYLTGSPLLTAS